MKVKIAFSQKKDIKDIIAELKGQINGFDAKFIQFFASPDIDPNKISKSVHEAFNFVPTIGCSSSGEIISGKMLDKSIVLMAMGSDIIGDCKIEVLEDVSANDMAVDTAFESIGEYFGESLETLDPSKYVGLVLIDGLSGQEETINERIGDLTNILFIGGSAGDDLKFEQTYIYANGKSYTNAVALAVLKCNTSFDILKTQSFKSLGKQVTVTKADEPTRTVLELNGKPAVQEYATILGIAEHELPSKFYTNPVGLVFGEDFFVRSPQKIAGDNIVFYCGIKEGMELDVLDSQNIIDDTKTDLNRKIDSFGHISAILNFNCILRTLEMKEKKQDQAYGQLFKDIPTIGFSTYGESFIGHMNQTATMLLFK